LVADALRAKPNLLHEVLVNLHGVDNEFIKIARLRGYILTGTGFLNE